MGGVGRRGAAWPGCDPRSPCKTVPHRLPVPGCTPGVAVDAPKCQVLVLPPPPRHLPALRERALELHLGPLTRPPAGTVRHRGRWCFSRTPRGPIDPLPEQTGAVCCQPSLPADPETHLETMFPVKRV